MAVSSSPLDVGRVPTVEVGDSSSPVRRNAVAVVGGDVTRGSSAAAFFHSSGVIPPFFLALHHCWR